MFVRDVDGQRVFSNVFSKEFLIDGRSWSWRALTGLWAVMIRSQGLCWLCWAALGAYVGGLGPLLGPMLAILVCCQGLSWRSRAALGAQVGGPEGAAGPKLAVLPALRALPALGADQVKSGPNPSGSWIWTGVGPAEACWGALPILFTLHICIYILYIYIYTYIYTHMIAQNT